MEGWQGVLKTVKESLLLCVSVQQSYSKGEGTVSEPGHPALGAAVPPA